MRSSAPAGGCGILPPPRPGWLRSNRVGWRRSPTTLIGAPAPPRRRRRGAPAAQRGREPARCRRAVVTSVAHTSSPSASDGSSGSSVGRRDPGEHAAVEQRGVDGPRVGDADDELVEVRARVDAAARRPPRARPRARWRARRPAPRRRAARGDRGSRGRCDAASASSAWLVQMLLAAFSRRMSCSRARSVITNARRPSRSVVIADQAARDLAHERVGAGDDAEVRPAVLERDAERLALARGDVRAVLPGRGEHRERHGLDDAHEQRARGVGEPPDLGHVLEQAEDVRLGGDDARDRPVRVGQQPLERLEVGRARGRAGGDQRDLVDREAGAVGVGRERLRGSAGGRARETRIRSRRVARQVISAASAVAAPPS